MNTEIKKTRITEKTVKKYSKLLFTMTTLYDKLKGDYEPCDISINSEDNQGYYIVTLNKLITY